MINIIDYDVILLLTGELVLIDKLVLLVKTLFNFNLSFTLFSLIFICLLEVEFCLFVFLSSTFKNLGSLYLF